MDARTRPSVRIPDRVADMLRQARHIVALTGAGISKESGLPTFREAQTGLWAQFRPEDLATPDAFARDPRLVWQWYAWRRSLVRDATPNAAHDALVRLAQPRRPLRSSRRTSTGCTTVRGAPT